MCKAVIALFLIALVSSCTNNTQPSPSQPTTVTTAPKTINGTVVTEQTGCTKNTGNCWLPLYPWQAQTGTPLNLSEDPNGTCTKTNEANCWPQPMTTVTVVCKITVDGEVWFGVHIPAQYVLTMPKPADKVGDKIGYNKASFIKVTETPNTLATCV